MKTTTLFSNLAGLASVVLAQTYTSCNPLKQTCPADPALQGSVDYNFVSGPSNDFSYVSRQPTYSSSGAALTIKQSGDYPTLISNWYIMYGYVEVTLKTAPGVGIVSSAILISDDLDELDWEWLGSQNGNQVQTNYFGKGITGNYDRGTTISMSGSTSTYQTYAFNMTANSIQWILNGAVVRTLTPSTAESNQYPQTPMQLKIGIWSGGDSSNSAGTIQWAGGPTNYGAGPYSMYVQSVKATDYSTGKSYSYSDMSGSASSIKSNGGTINGNLNGAAVQPASTAPVAQQSSASAVSSAAAIGQHPSSSVSLSSAGSVPPSSVSSASPSGSSGSAQSSGSGSSGTPSTTTAAGSSPSNASASSSGNTTPSTATSGSNTAPTINAANGNGHGTVGSFGAMVALVGAVVAAL